ncbi:STAS domain-containing protein [Micromonospora sp. WMMD882]|uniref:STAS domain-containing protein n=1 Tax=Micromonospora sp. WMMD882 TaxID=3015151 RepID=UPI00248CF4D1|nr:STAS domain-containing protein [Micromonospora sp. WMMD882]WBB81081.1 STAS domain-containing protein [Micromonospora sp. WMMD882]
MTVVPGLRADTVNLICDHCGTTDEAVPAVLPEPEVVWTVLGEHGWDGSPFAVGPHRCPGCTAAALATPPVPPADAVPAPERDRGAWRVDVEEVAGVRVLTPSGDIDVLVADVLREALATALAEDRDVVADLSRVGMIDSTGLGLLVRAHRDARQRGRSFCLVAPSRFVLTVLHTMRLDAVFLVFDHRSQALTCLTPQV